MDSEDSGSEIGVKAEGAQKVEKCVCESMPGLIPFLLITNPSYLVSSLKN